MNKCIQRWWFCLLNLLLSLLFVPCVISFGGSATPTKKSTSLVGDTLLENRRGSLSRIASTFISTMSIATGVMILPTTTTAVETSAEASLPSSSSPFEGTYTDPINHPGGTRTIKILKGLRTGDYQLAEIQGGGGIGEPKNYVLPAVIIGDKSILIDFSSKGGPKDFVGVLSSEGDLLFKLDGNKWPRVK